MPGSSRIAASHITEDTRSGRALLVAPLLTEPRSAGEAALAELALLCTSAGLQPVISHVVRVRQINPATYINSGQLADVLTLAEEHDARVIVFDRELSPVHMRNIARRSHLEVYDRHAVILEIFFKRATSKAAKLQVELARARYAQSHLVGMWQHLDRQSGSSNLARGEGETQIELDRRQLAARVKRARHALRRLGDHRTRSRNSRGEMAKVALVGYTNAGKSTLLNALAHNGKPVLARNALFATLDPATRRVWLQDQQYALVTDTIGFVDRLPPELVDAFDSTLEEIRNADLAVVVVDGSDRRAAQQLRTVLEVLERIDASGVPRMLVLNKSDRTNGALVPGIGVQDSFVGGELSISAYRGTGIGELRTRIAELVATKIESQTH